MRKKTIVAFFWILSLSSLILFACSSNIDPKEIQKPDSLTAAEKLKAQKLMVFDTLAGKTVFESKCLVCHQESGIGIPGTFPPLAHSDYLLADKIRALNNVANGFKDSILVNGITYKRHLMPEIELSDEQLRDVMNYILNSWGNKGGIVTIKDAKAAQK
jgi:mono/diheme cytochrome c family protein